MVYVDATRLCMPPGHACMQGLIYLGYNHVSFARIEYLNNLYVISSPFDSHQSSDVCS